MCGPLLSLAVACRAEEGILLMSTVCRRCPVRGLWQWGCYKDAQLMSWSLVLLQGCTVDELVCGVAPRVHS